FQSVIADEALFRVFDDRHGTVRRRAVEPNRPGRAQDFGGDNFRVAVFHTFRHIDADGVSAARDYIPDRLADGFEFTRNEAAGMPPGQTELKLDGHELRRMHGFDNARE